MYESSKTTTTDVDLVGYSRVSTTLQDPALQHDALTAAGCTRIFTDTASGKLASRPQLDACLDYLRSGDTLVVWRLDRFGRSLRDLIDRMAQLNERGIGFRSIMEGIDLTTPTGRMCFHIFGALAEFESDLIKERVNAGLATARARGRKGGRRTVMTPKRTEHARQMLASGETVMDVARTLGVSRTTLYRHLDLARR